VPERLEQSILFLSLYEPSALSSYKLVSQPLIRQMYRSPTPPIRWQAAQRTFSTLLTWYLYALSNSFTGGHRRPSVSNRTATAMYYSCLSEKATSDLAFYALILLLQSDTFYDIYKLVREQRHLKS
jgi:hypothetical protein